MFDDMAERGLASSKVKKLFEWDKWCKEIPRLNFRSDWNVKIMPPFGGAIIRFNCEKNGNYADVYLDCYDEKGNEKPDAKDKRKKLQEELDKKQTQMVIWINDIINNFQNFVDSAKDALDKETDGAKRVELEKNYNTLNELLPKIGLLLTYENSIYNTILSTVDENIYKPVSEMASETKKEIDKIKDTLKLFKELVDKSITIRISTG